MRSIFSFLFTLVIFVSCEKGSEKPFNINQEPLSSEAEVIASNWNGYNDFVFELKTLTENFSKEYAIEKTRNLLSKSQAILYSMPNELRNETTNEKATELVNLTKELYSSMTTKSEEEITDGLNKIVVAYTALNKEINYYADN